MRYSSPAMSGRGPNKSAGLLKSVIGVACVAISSATSAQAQHDHGAANGDAAAMAAHMEMTPTRSENKADAARAALIADQLRTAISKYRDVKVAIADGFKQFAPQMKDQRMYHFTNHGRAFRNEFAFDASRPTSLLYKKDSAGRFVLTGAMYTAPKRATADDLDKRVPLSVAQWHKHVNWCLPPRREQSRWTETKNGKPVFGPLGVATRKDCDAAGGRFQDELFGWMVHANVFEGTDPKIVWGDEHMMTGDEMVEHKH